MRPCIKYNVRLGILRFATSRQNTMADAIELSPESVVKQELKTLGQFLVMLAFTVTDQELSNTKRCDVTLMNTFFVSFTAESSTHYFCLTATT